MVNGTMPERPAAIASNPGSQSRDSRSIAERMAGAISLTCAATRPGRNKRSENSARRAKYLARKLSTAYSRVRNRLPLDQGRSMGQFAGSMPRFVALARLLPNESSR